MSVDDTIGRILRLYPADCAPSQAVSVPTARGFSGAQLWRLTTPRGTLCLRRWPAGHPSRERLEFIQAVLWHVVQEGFLRVPLPLETQNQHGFVQHAGHLWQVEPWLPGEPDYRRNPNPSRLRNAAKALALFHQAAASFPLAENGPLPSPGMQQRCARLEGLLAEGAAKIAAAVSNTAVNDAAVSNAAWPELAERARRLLAFFTPAAKKLLPQLHAAQNQPALLQPCIRDVWHAHILFAGDVVSGIVDFGALRADNVATDVARLFGSLAGDNTDDWQTALAAYESIHPLSAEERSLVVTFDRSGVLMSGLQWLEWIYLEQRVFGNRGEVIARLDEHLSRLGHLAETV